MRTRVVETVLSRVPDVPPLLETVSSLNLGKVMVTSTTGVVVLKTKPRGLGIVMGTAIGVITV